MKQKLLPIIGLCLILGSLFWILGLRLQTQADQNRCQTLAGQLEAMLPERTPGLPDPEAGMPALEIEGRDYVALLEVPGFGVLLPVEDPWNNRLRTPARFSGSAWDELVIGGPEAQFYFCEKIDPGAQILLTDMTGAEFTYTVTRVDRAREARREWLEGWDLTLFCQDSYAMEYIALRCELAYP